MARICRSPKYGLLNALALFPKSQQTVDISRLRGLGCRLFYLAAERACLCMTYMFTFMTGALCKWYIV